MKEKEFYVLLTKRFAPEFLSRFAASGIKWIQQPLIEISFREVPQLQHQLDKIQAPYIFTSKNAIRSFMLNNLKPKTHNAFVISGGSADLLLENNWNILGKAEDASSLADLILSSGRREFIFCCGDRRLDILPEKLKACGIRLHEFVLYETHLKAQRISDKFDAVVFFSPSAVEAFFSMNSLPAGCLVFCLGKSTATELSKHTKAEVISGTRPVPESLFKAILKKHNEHTQ